MSTITPTGSILDVYRYNITLDVYRRTSYGTHMTNLRFRLFRRDPNRPLDEPVDDRHIEIADESGVDSPLTFPVSAATDYFLRITKSGYHRAERNLSWRIKPEKFKYLPLIYGEGHGIVQGPNRIYAEELAPGGIFTEEALDRWGRFEVLMDLGGSTPSGEGTLILDKGFGIKTLACSGNYSYDDVAGDWVYQGPEYTHTKASDMSKYLLHNYTEDMPLVWIMTYKEWESSGLGQKFLTLYPTRTGNPGTPEANENNFQLWIEDENSNPEANAFEYYIDPNDSYFSNPSNPSRFEIHYK